MLIKVFSVFEQASSKGVLEEKGGGGGGGGQQCYRKATGFLFSS